MASRRGKRAGNSAIKIVRKILSDGTVREYRYSKAKYARQRFVADRSNAIGKLAREFYEAPEFKRCSIGWQKATRFYVTMMEDALGWATLDDLNHRKIRGEFYTLRDKHSDLPHRADKLMNTLRRILGWAYDRAKLDVNHALGIERLVPSSQSRAEHIWLPEHEARLFSVVLPDMVRLYWFALYTVLRQGDICAIEWPQFDGRWLTVRPGKTAKSTGVVVHLPVFRLPPLAALIEQLPRNGKMMLVTDNGMPWHVDNVRTRFSRATRQAGLREIDLTFHDIRGTGITRMQEAGCTDAETAAISGHAIGRGSKLGDYTARTRRLAENAYAKWAADMAGVPKVVPLFGGIGK
jgi:integrase